MNDRMKQFFFLEKSTMPACPSLTCFVVVVVVLGFFCWFFCWGGGGGRGRCLFELGQY